MRFYPYASVEMPRRDNGLVAGDNGSIADFWACVEEEIEEGLSGAVGCFIFSIRAGKGALPWYVGKAEKQTFRKECFTSHKLNHYNNAIAGRKGTPLLLFIPKLTKGDKYAKPSGNGHRDIEALEKMLISTCVQRNARLLNIRDTKLLREMIVPGYLNNRKGKEAASVKGFRALLGL